MNRLLSFRLLLVLALTALLALPALAQPHRHERQNVAERLDLSETQRTELQTLRQQQMEAIRSWRDANPEATRDDIRAFREEQRASMEAALRSILTPEQRDQLTTFQERAEQRRGDRQERRHARRDRAMRGMQSLDLTGAQQEALRTLRDEQRTARASWREANHNATADERAAFNQRQREAMRLGMEQILTAEQQAELTILREQRGDRVKRKRGRGDRMQRQRSDQQSPAEDLRRPDFGLDNYPNPFNPSTEIRFALSTDADVTLAVFDLQGRQVAQLLQGRLNAGTHQATFDASSLPSGVYLYRLTVDGTVQTGRMTLMK